MPTRLVREGFISSARINALSMGAEVFYHRLMLVADDYGRYHASVVTLRGACWPTNPEKVSEKDVSKWLNELLRGDSPLVRTYSVAGASYLEIQNFQQRTRSESRFPDPPWLTNDGQLTDKCPQPADNPPTNDGAMRRRYSETETETETNEKHNAPTGALSLVPASDHGSVVRPAVSPRRKNRTTEEIRKALGERLLWWEEFWKIYPCHEGTRAAMDAFERRVKDRATAEAVYRGAKAYAQRLCANPEIIPKWGQGWINDERWLDENRVRDPPNTTDKNQKRRNEVLAGMQWLSSLEGQDVR